MEPTFLMIETAIQSLLRFKSLSFINEFLEFYGNDKLRKQFIGWEKQKYSVDVENMRKEITKDWHGAIASVQIAMALRLTSCVEKEKVLEYDEKSIARLIDEHNKKATVHNESIKKGIYPVAQKDIDITVDINEAREASRHALKWQMKHWVKEGDTVRVFHVMEVVNTEHLPAYIEFLKDATLLFERAVSDYIQLYKEGKIPAATPVTIHVVKDKDLKKALVEFNQLGDMEQKMESKVQKATPVRRLNPCEAAILFEYLCNKDVMINYDASTKATMVHYITGLNFQNIRADGFGHIDDLMKGKIKPKRERDYNQNVKKLLQEIIADIDKNTAET